MKDIKIDIWELVKKYVKKCGYTYSKEQFIDFYYNYYLKGAYCPYTFNDVMKNYEQFNKENSND